MQANGKVKVAIRIGDIDVVSYKVRELNVDYVRRLAEVYEIGGRFAEIPEVCYVNESPVLIKGHHRIEAARRTFGDDGMVQVLVAKYENDDARWEAAASDNVKNARPYMDPECEHLYRMFTREHGWSSAHAREVLGMPESRGEKIEAKLIVMQKTEAKSSETPNRPERAMASETPSPGERAKPPETPTRGERATEHETPIAPERAKASEAPTLIERAMQGETPRDAERATEHETPSGSERPSSAAPTILFHVGRLMDALAESVYPENVTAALLGLRRRLDTILGGTT